MKRIALLIETSRYYGRGLLRGIAKYSHLHGPLAFYSETGGRNKISYAELKDWKIDGIIARDEKLDKGIMEMGLPLVVYVSRTEPKKYQHIIIANNIAIGTMAAEHFLERKYRHFGYCGFSDVYYSKMRLKSFADRLAQEGFSVSVYEKTQRDIKHSWEKEQNRICEWLQKTPKPIAIFACIDERSRHVAEACKRSQLNVPEDVAILGVDDDILVCELSDPPLSSVAMNPIEGGYEATKLLMDMINGKKVKQKQVVILPTHITIRRSTDILAIDDKEVINAITYIKDNAKKPLQVEDVVKHVALSRRSLEVKFRNTIGRTPHDFIKHIRIQKISEILRTTDLSIKQIDQLFGFHNSNNLARYYKQATGITCHEYRRKIRNTNI